MKGYTKVSNEVLLETTLTMGARLAYGVVLHFAWRAGRRKEDDGVVLPALDRIAAAVGCSRTATQTYMRELRVVGLIVTVRVKNQGMAYFIFDSIARSDSDLASRRARSKSGLDLGRNPTQLGEPDLSLKVKDNFKEGEAYASPSVPVLEKVDGQNLGMNALGEACGVNPSGSGAIRLAAALNGSRGKKGIRQFFWQEIVEWAHEHDKGDELAHAHGERFERALARAITERAAMYRAKVWQSDPTVPPSPSALLSRWSDLPTMAERRQPAMTADDIRTFKA